MQKKHLVIEKTKGTDEETDGIPLRSVSLSTLNCCVEVSSSFKEDNIPFLTKTALMLLKNGVRIDG